MLACWLIALSSYVGYGALYLGASSIAAKAGVATIFVTVSVTMWVLLHRHDRHR